METIDPFPGIEWASNTYNEQGDEIACNRGVTKIGIGSQLYTLLGSRPENQSLSVRQVPAISPARIYIGRPDSLLAADFKVDALGDHPFNVADPVRINEAASLAKKVGEIETGYWASREIGLLGQKYLDFIKRIVTVADANDALKEIAVLGQALERYTTEDYPDRFMDVARTMEELRLESIFSIFKFGNGSYHPNLIRQAFG